MVGESLVAPGPLEKVVDDVLDAAVALVAPLPADASGMDRLAQKTHPRLVQSAAASAGLPLGYESVATPPNQNKHMLEIDEVHQMVRIWRHTKRKENQKAATSPLKA